MLTLIIIVAVAAAGIAYLVTKSKVHLSSIEESIKETVEKVETAVAPAIEEVKEVVEEAAKVAPKNKTIKQVKVATDTVKTKKPAAKTTAKKK